LWNAERVGVYHLPMKLAKMASENGWREDENDGVHSARG